MLRPSQNILLIGDAQREVQDALIEALPQSRIVSVGNYFDGIAELSANHYSAVLAASEPIERRPEAAVGTLRKAVGDGRLVLFGHPTLEPLARKMLEFGCDDYIVTPADAAELRQVFGRPPLRLAESHAAGEASEDTAALDVPEVGDGAGGAAEGAPTLMALEGVPLTELVLDAMVQHPADAPGEIIARVNALLQPEAQLQLTAVTGGETGAQIEAGSGPELGVTVGMDRMALSQPVRVNAQDVFTLTLHLPAASDSGPARHWLSQVAHLLGKVTALQDRHNRLQKLAITDDLTGLYNGRYFRHFLTRILERARMKRFPVTLLLFDIDNFKQYNDRFGHGVGDGILQQTGALMRRCVRDHDLVARISGDEFAVVFWEKDGPRQPQNPNAGVSGRPPQTPLEVFQRFQRLLASEAFPALGAQGMGTLTISGGLAVYPYDASSVDALIEAADKALMLGAKREGKNSIVLVGGDPAGETQRAAPPAPPAG